MRNSGTVRPWTVRGRSPDNWGTYGKQNRWGGGEPVNEQALVFFSNREMLDARLDQPCHKQMANSFFFPNCVGLEKSAI